MSSRRSRQHSTGWAYAGSQRQIQAYVNNAALTPLLDQALRQGLPTLEAGRLEWRAPLAAERYDEPQDTTFWAAIDRPDLWAQSRDWWPSRGGPAWDAVALGHRADRAPAVVLVEAKANAAELAGGAFAGTSPRSIAMVTAALEGARRALGARATIDAWTGSYYQLANRLAWTLWLREHSVDAVFAHVLFADDLSHRPTSEPELRDAVGAAHESLGLPEEAIVPWAATVVLPATK